jgi:hypothetical protein
MGTSYSTIKQVEKIVRDVEAQRAKKPSNMFLLTSLGALSIALLLKFTRKKNLSLFVSQWASPFLLYIICKKLVHQLGVTGQEPD